jgi:hypothetical protein
VPELDYVAVGRFDNSYVQGSKLFTPSMQPWYMFDRLSGTILGQAVRGDPQVAV